MSVNVALAVFIIMLVGLPLATCVIGGIAVSIAHLVSNHREGDKK